MLLFRRRKLTEYLFLILFTFLTFGAAIAVGLIAKCNFINNILTFFCDLLLITNYTISLLFLLYLIFHRKQQKSAYRNGSGGSLLKQSPSFDSSSTANNSNMTILSKQLTYLLTSNNQRESNLAIYTFISILGVGDSIFNLTRSIDQLFAIISIDYEHENKIYLLSSFVENFMKLIYQIFLLLFIIYHKDYENIYCSKAWLKWFIGYLSISCLIQWIFIILQEIFQERGYYSLTVTTYRLSSINLTSFHDYEPFLYPLGIEFRICCFIELLFIFLSSFGWMCKKYPTAVAAHADDSIIQTRRLLFKPTNKILLPTHHSSKSSLFFILMVFTIFLFSISISVMLFQYTNLETNTEIVSLLHELCELIVLLYSFLLMFLHYTSCSTSSSSSSSISSVQDNRLLLFKATTSHIYQHSRNKLIQLRKCELMKQIDFIFLYISFAFLSIECLLTIIGDLIILSTNKTSSSSSSIESISSISISTEVIILTLFTAALTILQSCLQLKQMWNISKKLNLNKKCMNMAILLNLIIWLFDTFGDHKLAKNQVQIQSYGIQAWEQFSPIFLPLAIFYRFHSCIVLVKIKYEKYLVRND